MTIVSSAYRGSDSEQSLVRTTITDATGRFELKGIVRKQSQPIGLFAIKPGYVARRNVIRDEEETHSIDLKLAPAAAQAILVQGPEGKAVADAVVTELTFGSEQTYTTIDQNVLEAAPLRSDANGKLTIDIVPAGTGLAIGLASSRLGRQRRWFPPEESDRTFRFEPVGSLVGRIEPPDGLKAEGINVEVQVRKADNPYVLCSETVKVGPDNCFRIPALMAGAANLRAVVQPGSELRAGLAAQVTIEPGKEHEADIQLVRGVPITGTVLALDDDKPIAGAKLNVWNNATREYQSNIVTNDQGRYSVFVGPGQINASISEVPLPYYVGVRESASETVKEGAPPTEMPPIRLPRGTRCAGIVVDEAGQPVARAWVSASWWEEQDRLMTTGSRSAQADDKGRFVLEGVSSRVEIYLRADTPQAAGLEYTTVPVGNKEDVRLTISPKGVAVVTGRIVDSQGQPIAGASIQINAGYRSTSNSRYSGEQIEWNLTTDAQGRFSTPQAVRRHLTPPERLGSFSTGGYYVRVTSPGLLDNTLTVTVGPEGDPFAIPDITLIREGRVAGRVVDRAGKPLSGARVHAAGLQEHQAAAAATDEAGRFELKQVHPEAVFVFAAGDGFVFTGHPIPADDGDMTIVLSTREEAANDPPLAPRQPTPDESAAALKQILVPLWDKLDPREHAYQRGEILQRMAAHDPEWTVAKLAELGGPRYAIPVLRKLGRTDDALIAVTALRGSYERSYTLVDIARDIPAPDRRQALMGEAFAEARSVIEPTNRLAAMMKIAEALRDFGEHDAARRIVEENLPEIEKLEAGFYRGHIAETVALFNLDKALKLCEGATDEYERDRHPGNIAHKLAGIDPDKAERAYNLVSDRNQYRYVPRVCYRMAPVDLPRAKAIAEAASKTYGDQRPYVYGVMALALAHNNPPEARKLLRQAFELMHGTDPRSDDRRRFQAALALMRIAEIVDPTATRECFWRAVSLAPGTQMRTAYEWEAEQKLEYNAMLAVLLTRYGEHPEIARRLVEPLYTSDKLKASQMREGVFPIAMAMIDPAKAANWLQEKYFAETKPDERRYIPQPQELMADAVGGDDEALWKALHDRVLHLWLPDEVD